ncbi:MAG: S8 family serine peptidase, partial [Bacteroidota bacterium]
WLATKGKGIKIAIIDSGIFQQHPNLAHIDSAHIHGATTKNNPTVDRQGHGTHVTGIINGRLADGKGISGIAPEAEVFCIKARDDTFNYFKDSVVDAIQWAINQQVHLINMSFTLLADTAISNKLAEASSKGILLVAAAGDNQRLNNQPLFFPADTPECLAIGGLTEASYAQNILPRYQQGGDAPFANLDLVLPNFPMESCYKATGDPASPGYFKKEEGSSMATAFMSGTIALLLAHLINNEGMNFSAIDLAVIKNRLNSITEPLKSGFISSDQIIRFYNPKIDAT